MNDSPHTLKHLADWYKERVKIPGLGAFLKGTLEYCISVWAYMKNFSFPEKYIWEWKIDVLAGTYEKDTTELFKKIIKPGMTVADIGGHIGYFTRLFSELASPNGKVFAFEPDPQNLSFLKRNTAGLRNVAIVEAAVSDTTGVIDFYEVEGSTACHSTIPSSAPSKKLSVKAVTLDQFAKEHAVVFDVIKIDIEGSEMHAFAGMRELLGSGRPLAVVSELNPNALMRAGTSAPEMIALFASLGFSAYAILPEKQVPLNADTLLTLTFMKGKEEYTNVLFIRE